MAKDGIISGIWTEGPAKVTLRLPLIIFSEDESWIAYCPALDLSGYGTDEDEAQDSFRTVLSEYLSYTAHKKTLAKDLQHHGWELKKNLREGATPPTMEQLLKTNDDFNRIFNFHDFKKVETTVDLPAY